ncbi:hypothetical protein P3T76_000318 [Phytophthora citrophthora]|uniref:Elicitin-like protein n=1 Tax=Phytophthora citrophthora TaxID=4793 RepID=A0AAD9H1E7_9STRA|nr:hypothetical protein P3T76_000318 [Phytophthora citrophthora]
MRTFTPVLLLATVAAVASAQTTSGSSTASLASASGSGSASLPAELAAIAECNSTELNDAQTTLTSNQREAQCEEALSLQSGTMLQVTTADADQMCETASCKAALQELYNELPNCRYELWGLQYSAKKLLEYCATTPTNSSSSDSSGSVNWSVTSGSASFAAPGATDAPSTASSTNSDSSASTGSSAATTTTTMSAALAVVAGLVATYLA